MATRHIARRVKPRTPPTRRNPGGMERLSGKTAHMSNRPLREIVGMTPDEARARRRSLPVLTDRDYEKLSETCGEAGEDESPCASPRRRGR